MTNSDTRDISLDMLKGLACCYLIIAHSLVLMTPGSYIDNIFVFIHTNTAMFFSASGFLAYHQSRGGSFPKLIILYAFIFLLGSSINGMRLQYYIDLQGVSIDWSKITAMTKINLHPSPINIYRTVECDVLQIIAIGCIAVLAATKLLKNRYYLYYIAALVIFALYKILSVIIPDFYGRSFFIAPGVFSIIPWIMYFFAGVTIYTMKNNYNLLFGIVYLLVFAIFNFGFGIDLSWKDKHGISYGAFLISFAVTHLDFFIFRFIGSHMKDKNRKMNVLRYFGENSILFFYVHFYFCFVFLFIGIGLKKAFNTDLFMSWFVVWPGIFFATLGIMVLLMNLNKKIKSRMMDIRMWWALVVLIFTTPLIGWAVNLGIFTVMHIEFLYGLVFALRYRDLSTRIKNGPATIARQE